MQEPLFTLVESIESDKHEDFIIAKGCLENVICRFGLQPFSDSPVYHTLIRKPLTLQQVVIFTVKRIQHVPYLKEALLDRRIIRLEIDGKLSRKVTEMADKAFDRLPLDIRKVRIIILELLQVSHIGKKLLGIGKVFIHIVKVSQDDISPEDEFIQRLSLLIKFCIASIQIQKKSHLVCRSSATDFIEEVIDCQHTRHDNRNSTGIGSQGLSQMLSEEHHRASVREDEAAGADFTRIIIISCNLF